VIYKNKNSEFQAILRQDVSSQRSYGSLTFLKTAPDQEQCSDPQLSIIIGSKTHASNMKLIRTKKIIGIHIHDSNFKTITKGSHKFFFLVVGPPRGGRGKGRTTKKKRTFFTNVFLKKKKK